MPRKPAHHSVLSATSNLAGPLIFGSGASFAFYALIWYGPLNNELMLRYFSGFWISYLATGMFFVGLSALVIKFFGLLSQEGAFGRISLPEKTNGGSPAEASTDLIEILSELPSYAANSYLGRRLREALEFVSQKNSADGIDDHLKYLADVDADRQHDSNALVRIIIWATPMLGFLGTVIGITLALGGLSGSELANDPEAALNGLVSGLYVAFDTTAVALGLSIVLMFVQFLLDQFETQHLSRVDAFITDELTGRFEEVGAGKDPQVASMERMSRAMIRATEALVVRQTELWQSSILEVEQRSQRDADEIAARMQNSLAAALSISLEKHASAIEQSQQQAQQKLTQLATQFAEAMQAGATAVAQQQAAVTKQSEAMQGVVQSTADVVKLESALNENLRALAGSSHFEETVISLSAAIQLLTAKLGSQGQASNASQGKAA